MFSERERKVLGRIEETAEDIILYLQRLIGFKIVTPPQDGRGDTDDKIWSWTGRVR